MDRLAAMTAFVRVVENGGFHAAARVIGTSASSVSRQVSTLEDHLDARLLHRTTRSMRLTDVGETYYQRCRQLLSDLDEAEQFATRTSTEPRGLLRLTAPLGLGTAGLGPILSSFLERYADVELHVTLTDRMTDLVEEGFDVALRAGALGSANVVARRLADGYGIAVATPAYLDRCGRPETLEELRQHELLMGSLGTFRGWRLASGEVVARTGRLVANDATLLGDAVAAGLGIAVLPWTQVRDDVRSGRLEAVLPGLTGHVGTLWVVYPERRHLSAKVRAFVDHVVAAYSDPTMGWREEPTLAGFASKT